MTDYARERRAYVSQIRSSFDENMDEIPERLQERVQEQKLRGGEHFWVRLRFCAAVFLFLLFFYWKGSGQEIGGITPAKMTDMIKENRYDAIFQEYDVVLEQVIHTGTE